jgi:hypothetical protein
MSARKKAFFPHEQTGVAAFIMDKNGNRAAEVDYYSHELKVIAGEHAAIHGGYYYRAFFQKDVAGSGTANMLIQTANTANYLHFRYEVDAEAEASILFYEGVTHAAGTAFTPQNANRNSSEASETTIKTDVTETIGTAVTLVEMVIGSGKTYGGGATAEYEWVLKPNTQYLILVTNQTATANEVNILLSWYEYEPKGDA